MKKTFRQHCGEVSVIAEPIKAKEKRNWGEEKLRQFCVKASSEMNLFNLHHYFTNSSPVFETFSLENCRNGDVKMSAVFNDLSLLPHIADYTRKSPIQFDIPSSYLYVVVLKDL